MKKLFFFATILLASPLWRDGRGVAQTTIESGSGNALSFDGISDYVGDIGTAASFNFIQNTGVFTVELWVKLNSLTDKEYMIVGNTPTGVERGFWFETLVSGGLVNLRVNIPNGSGSLIISDSPPGVIQDTQWHHVVAVGDGTRITFFVDGVFYLGTGTMGTFATGLSSRLLQIGDTYSIIFGPGAFNFNGNIDEVRIWNRALTQAEIQQNMCTKLPDNYGYGLVGYWRFDEGVDNTCNGGQDVCDASGNGNNGIKF